MSLAHNLILACRGGGALPQYTVCNENMEINTIPALLYVRSLTTSVVTGFFFFVCFLGGFVLEHMYSPTLTSH